MSIFKKIGQFFKSLFNAAKKAYERLSTDEQEALQKGSGIVALINMMVENTPEEVRAAIEKRFPELDAEQLEQALFKVLNTFGIIGTETPVNNIEELIGMLQQHLQDKTGKEWATASHIAASVLAVFFVPKETKVAVIVSLIEWVYQHFIKKSL